MMELIVGGERSEVELSPDKPLAQVLAEVREKLQGSGKMVSAIFVDGKEILPDSNQDGLPEGAAVSKVEVHLATPNQIALDTLMTLGSFVAGIIPISKRISGKWGTPEFESDFMKVLDGVEILVEAINAARIVLGIGGISKVSILDADLLSILEDLHDCRKKKDLAYLHDLLESHLPQNLQDWIDEGIPSLLNASSGV